MKTCRQITTLVNIAGGALLLGLSGTLMGFVSFFAIFSSETTVFTGIPVGEPRKTRVTTPFTWERHARGNLSVL